MDALLIACSDGRIAPILTELQQKLGIEEAHRLLLPGGPLALVKTGADLRIARHWVEAIVSTHGVRRVVLVSHQNCFAYERALGGLGFDQRSILERDLRRVKAKLEDEHLGVAVECWFVPWREDAGDAAFAPAERLV